MYLLFFLASASKSRALLIVIKSKFSENPNEIQREFDSNVRIATFETSLGSKSCRQKTNLLKPKRVKAPSPSASLRAQWGRGLGVGFAVKPNK
jgi:hypothetical protein